MRVTSHWVHLAAPVGLEAPAGQGVHEASRSELNVPAAQFSQAEPPDPAENVPVRHGDCAVAPWPSTKNPAFALVHFDAPSSAIYVPAEHGVCSVAP